MKCLIRPLTMLVAVITMMNAICLSGQQFTLVYDRMSLCRRGYYAGKSIRVTANDGYLLLANDKPYMLLRSVDNGKTFELAANVSDAGYVEYLPTFFLWDNAAASVIGQHAHVNTRVSLYSPGLRQDFVVSGQPGRPPSELNNAATYEPGIALSGNSYTTDYGVTWKAARQAYYEYVFSPIHGLITRGTDNKWYRYDSVTNTTVAFSTISSSYAKVRSLRNGTLIGFTSTSIARLRVGDTNFTQQLLFKLPNHLDSVELAIIPEATWRGDTVFCTAHFGDDWYLMCISDSLTKAVPLAHKEPDSHFRLEKVDERGCLVREHTPLNSLLRFHLFDRHGQLRGIQKIPDFDERGVDDRVITWSDSAMYFMGFGSDMGHLYRSTQNDPRLEHIGERILGDAALNQFSMPWCELDTLNGSLIGIDKTGTLIQFTNTDPMRGFFYNSVPHDEPQTPVDIFRFVGPRFIISDSSIVARLHYSASLGKLYIIDQNNPYNTTMLAVDSASRFPTLFQNAGNSNIFFGSRDIRRIAINGTLLDSMVLILPGENRDSVGVVTNIVEIDSSTFVVSIQGHALRRFDETAISKIAGGIVRTTDHGKTWQRSELPEIEDQAFYTMSALRSGVLLAVSINTAILIDSATTSEIATCYGGNILRSTDAGKSWSVQSTFDLNSRPYLTNCSYRIWQGRKRIFIATPQAVLISTDDGRTWNADNDFPVNCTINSVAEHRGELYVATTMGIYRENASTSVSGSEVTRAPSITASAHFENGTWRITVTGLPTSRITDVNVYDIQARQIETDNLYSSDNSVTVTSPINASGVYGVVVHGTNNQRWTTAVIVE